MQVSREGGSPSICEGEQASQGGDTELQLEYDSWNRREKAL